MYGSRGPASSAMSDHVMSSGLVRARHCSDATSIFAAFLRFHCLARRYRHSVASFANRRSAGVPSRVGSRAAALFSSERVAGPRPHTSLSPLSLNST